MGTLGLSTLGFGKSLYGDMKEEMDVGAVVCKRILASSSGPKAESRLAHLGVIFNTVKATEYSIHPSQPEFHLLL